MCPQQWVFHYLSSQTLVNSSSTNRLNSVILLLILDLIMISVWTDILYWDSYLSISGVALFVTNWTTWSSHNVSGTNLTLRVLLVQKLLPDCVRMNRELLRAKPEDPTVAGPTLQCDVKVVPGQWRSGHQGDVRVRSQLSWFFRSLAD